MRSLTLVQFLLARKQSDDGMTLIEVMVIIVIIGILSSMTWPTLLGQVNKAKEVEPTSHIGIMNRTQQIHYLEHNEFADTLAKLQVGIPESTYNYNYYFVLDSGLPAVTHQAQPLTSSLRPILGGVMWMNINGELILATQLCKGEVSPLVGGPTGTELMTFDPINGPQCPSGYRAL